MRSLAVASLLFAQALMAWDGQGHQLIASAAFHKLDEPTKARLIKLLEQHPKYACWVAGLPAGNTKAARNRRLEAAIREAATWPDGIKDLESNSTFPLPHCYSATDKQGAKAYENDGDRYTDATKAGLNTGYADHLMHKYWHFDDIPFVIHGANAQQHQPQAINVVERINLFGMTLATPGNSPSALQRKSYDVVWLVHLVGDIHQPLHCESRYDGPSSTGDSGGNGVTVTSAHGESKLHSYWDHLGDHLQLGDLSAPPSAKVNDMVPDHWAQDSFELAKAKAYSFGADGTLTPAYEMDALSVATSQISLAASHLAQLLMTILASGGDL